MRLSEAAEPVFARHETFHPRYGWFRKAYEAAARDPHVFVRDDAPVRLGVGKNMVRAIRFWGLAAKVVTEVPDPLATTGRRATVVVPTQFGDALFGPGGFDPFMEDPATLWLLHWRLLAVPCRLPVWWLALCDFNAVEFEPDSLARHIESELRAVPDWKQPSASAVGKDLSAFMRSYAPAERRSREAVDDASDCPLRELRLVGRSAATGASRFKLGHKPTLAPAVAAHAVLDWAARIDLGGNTLTLDRVAAEKGSPASAYKLSEADLCDVISPAAEASSSLSLGSQIGVPQLSWKGEASTVAAEVLCQHYGVVPRLSLGGPEGDLPINFEERVAAERPADRLDVLDRLDRLEAAQAHKNRERAA